MIFHCSLLRLILGISGILIAHSLVLTVGCTDFLTAYYSVLTGRIVQWILTADFLVLTVEFGDILIAHCLVLTVGCSDFLTAYYLVLIKRRVKWFLTAHFLVLTVG
jgi:hypothetical protein